MAVITVVATTAVLTKTNTTTNAAPAMNLGSATKEHGIMMTIVKTDAMRKPGNVITTTAEPTMTKLVMEPTQEIPIQLTQVFTLELSGSTTNYTKKRSNFFQMSGISQISLTVWIGKTIPHCFMLPTTHWI